MDISEIEIEQIAKKIIEYGNWFDSDIPTPTLARAVLDQQAELARLREVERKAIEQSEYIQAHGLTEYEMNRKNVDILQKEAEILRLREVTKAAREYVNTGFASARHKLRNALEALP